MRHGPGTTHTMTRTASTTRASAPLTPQPGLGVAMPQPGPTQATPLRHGPADGLRGMVAAGRRAIRSRVQGAAEAGMATAEYAIATVAAAGFAGLLIVILRSDEVRDLLLGIVRGALSG